LQNIDLGEEYTKDASVSVNFLKDGLIVLIRESSMSHALRSSDIPSDFVSSNGTANSALLVSHDALSKIASDNLSKRAISVSGTDAVVKIISYSGSANKVSVQADVAKQTHRFKGGASWSGPDLKLGTPSLEPSGGEDCAQMKPIARIKCDANWAAEKAIADAIVLACGSTCFPTHVVPLTKDKKIKFELLGRRAFFAGEPVSAVSKPKALIVMINSNVGADH
jgi:hypothetical protein